MTRSCHEIALSTGFQRTERIFLINADHSSVCRFDPNNRTDTDNLKRVLNCVEDLCELALKKFEVMILPSAPQETLVSRLQALGQQ
jgi:hypothetical protein